MSIVYLPSLLNKGNVFFFLLSPKEGVSTIPSPVTYISNPQTREDALHYDYIYSMSLCLWFLSMKCLDRLTNTFKIDVIVYTCRYGIIYYTKVYKYIYISS